MENKIGSFVRGAGNMFQVEKPEKDESFEPDARGAVSISFAGSAIGLRELSSADVFELLLFNNQDIINPLATTPLSFIQDASGKMQYSVQQSLTLPPGLYYYSIEEGREQVFAGRFFVGKPNK